jgi:hypothetical protein
MQDIRIEWSIQWRFSVVTQGDHSIHWHVCLGRRRMTELMNTAAGFLPDALWRSAAAFSPAAPIWSPMMLPATLR